MQAAEMIVVPVADDQRLDLRRIDADQLHVVEQRFGRIAEVEHDRALLRGALRFQKQRQAPLVVEHVLDVGAASRPRAFVDDAIDRAAAQELIVPWSIRTASSACRWSGPGSAARPRSRRSRSRRPRRLRQTPRRLQKFTPPQIRLDPLRGRMKGCQA